MGKRKGSKDARMPRYVGDMVKHEENSVESMGWDYMVTLEYVLIRFVLQSSHLDAPSASSPPFVSQVPCQWQD